MSAPLKFPEPGNPDAAAELAEFNRKPIAQQAYIVANYAFANEQVTRKRLDKFLIRGFRERLRWLFLGK